MGQSQVRKDVISFNKGFTSDASAINFPDDFSVDEQNYDIEIDGTRRRRRGLSQDLGSTEVAIDRDSDERCRGFKWPAAANDSASNFVVVQFGRFIKFFEDLDDATVGDEKGFQIDLTVYKTDSTTNDEIDSQVVDMAVSRGELIIVGEYSEPLVVTYDPDTDNISVVMIQIRERDMYGIDDGIADTSMPMTLDTTHRYNLLNQGWTQANIDQFFSDVAAYPSKNMVYGRGFRRVIVTGVADIDGTKEFSSDKLVAELFQDAPAPRGHFILNPFDSENLILSETSSALNLLGIDLDLSPGTPGVNTVTITTSTNHGLSATDTIFIPNVAIFLYGSSIDGSVQSGGIIGQHTVVATPTATTFTISVDFTDLAGLQNPVVLQNNFTITVTDNLVVNEGGITTRKRPSTVAFFAGRIFYSGVNDGKLTTKIFFSQVVETANQFGKAYQVADPTDENIPELVATDGGVINIPEMGVNFRLMPYSSGLLVFSFNGVWFIGPGARGIFAADSYSVRKISNVGLDGPASVIIAEDFPHYWARNSIYRITQDSAGGGFLVAQNISIGRIDSFYNSLSTAARKSVQGAYDPLLKKIYWVYSTRDEAPNAGFTNLLILDMKYNAYIKMTVPYAGVTTPDVNEFSVSAIFTTKTPSPSAPQSTIKFVAQRSGDSLFVEFNGDSPQDTLYSTLVEEEAFLITGFDTGRVPSNRKQACFITVYSKKTETGYTEVGDDLVPVNESSTFMQTRWDWADHVNAGKWSSEQQVYRHKRLYVPVDENDGFDNGQPIVVTRNKVRGRGRSLHLKFSAGEGKHSHLMGWTTNYKVLTQE